MGAKVSTGERTRSFSGSVLMNDISSGGDGVLASDGYPQHHARSRYRTRSLSSAQRPGQQPMLVNAETDATPAQAPHGPGAASDDRPRSRSLLGSGLASHLFVTYDGMNILFNP